MSHKEYRAKLMENHSESSTYQTEQAEDSHAPSWLKMGAVAAASALAGGLAAAWFYRKTLARLHQAEAEPPDSECSIAEYDPGDGI